ncbi:PriCT-2 domain-containing protein [Azospirillum sp. A29]|uniref:PriCT-2 domain-containing protein n=1 Tax=Azospirillum sp. A29 TaxID=3160606 RepID=UPI00366BD4FF
MSVPPTQPVDTITILECTEDHRATKRIRLGPGATGTVIDGYDAGTWFMAREVPVSNFDDLAALLQEHSANPKAFVIRGASSGAWSLEFPVRRTSISKPMQPAAFRAQPRRWLAIDMDKVPMPAGTDPVSDPDDAIEYLRGQLPDEFQEASCWWQFTSGQGFKGDTLNSRLWFWLDRPLNDVQLRTWAREQDHIDAALYNAAEPHYIAAPILGPGVRDPLPRRSGVYRGETDAVSLRLPEREEMAAREWTRQLAADGGTEVALHEVVDYLNAIPNDDLGYDEWLSVGAKVKAAVGDAGEDAFAEWSARSRKNDDDVARRKYRSLQGGGSPLALYLMARDHGYSFDHIFDLGAIRVNALNRADRNRGAALITVPAGAGAADDEDWTMEDPAPSAWVPPANDASMPPAGAPPLSPPPAEAEEGDPVLPPVCYDLGGIGGLMVDWINRTARKPQPELAILNVLAALGAVYGRRYKTDTEIRTNLFTLGMVQTGAGKDHSRKLITKLFMSAGLSRLLAGDDVFSGSGLHRVLVERPSCLAQWDEFDELLQRVATEKQSSGIKKKLLTAYSSSSGAMLGAEYADAKIARVDVMEPHLNLYCTATPDGVFNTLSSKSVVDGFLNRFIVVTARRAARQVKIADSTPPDWLVDEMKRHADVRPEGGGNLSGVMTTRADIAPRYVVVTTDPAAAEMLDDAEDWQDEHLSGADPARDLFGRLRENANKVAAIRAISRDPAAPRITAEDAAYGLALVGHSAERLAEHVKQRVADGPREALVKKVRRLIESAGSDGLSMSEFTKRMCDVDPRVRRGILDDLVAAGDVAETITRSGGKGRPKTVLRAVA